MQRSNDCAVWEGDRPFLEGFDRYLIAELGAQLIDLVCHQVVHGDHFPIAVSGRNCDAVDRRGIARVRNRASLWLALFAALRRGVRSIHRTYRDSGATAQSTKVVKSAR